MPTISENENTEYLRCRRLAGTKIPSIYAGDDLRERKYRVFGMFILLKLKRIIQMFLFQNNRMADIYTIKKKIPTIRRQWGSDFDKA